MDPGKALACVNGLLPGHAGPDALASLPDEPFLLLLVKTGRLPTGPLHAPHGSLKHVKRHVKRQQENFILFWQTHMQAQRANSVGTSGSNAVAST